MGRKPLSRALRRAVGLAALAAPLLAPAQELSWSGFGTVGYARSNRDVRYERYIDSSGTLQRDSVFGLQADARLGAQWSATLQLRAAPALDDDNKWSVEPAWAFVGWRPDDNWLVRAGRLRVPLYLHSESLDVGVTYDLARLPTEMYSIAPTSDVDGLYLTRSWGLDSGDLIADVYTGRIDTVGRLWTRDGVPGAYAPGPFYMDIDVKLSGAVLTWRQPKRVLRAGWHHGSTKLSNGQPFPVRYEFVPVPMLGPGMGYYQVDASLPGPGVPTTPRVRNDVITLSIDEQFSHGWRVAAEYARNIQRDTEVGSDTRGGYVAVFKQLGRATPYVALGYLKSNDGQREWYRRLTGSPLPPAAPGADQINAAQRFAAESIYSANQRSVALGAAWSLGSRQKIKAEWKRTRIGQASRLVDTPPGEPDPSNLRIDILSLNYNFAF